jgi:hypothetical protein
MRVAWAASIAAQALLLASLLRGGRRDWWTAYLALDLVRSAVLWPLSGAAYWWAWMLLAPVLLCAQLAAVAGALRNVKMREVIHIGVIAGASCWLYSILLTSDAWPTARRVPLMLQQGATFGCFGALAAPLAYGEVTDKWMLIYYAFSAFHLIASQVTVLDASWNSLQLWVVAAVFASWSIKIQWGNCGRIRS